MQSVPERCAQKWLVVLVDEAWTTFWGIIEELVSESSKPAELLATVILQIFGVVLFSVVIGFTEIKKTPK